MKNEAQSVFKMVTSVFFNQKLIGHQQRNRATVTDSEFGLLRVPVMTLAKVNHSYWFTSANIYIYI